ncbi:MAG: DNA-directed DNA polymerase II small subunit [Candidatus Methanomethylophilus sp.]|nr:DNA-directed DNA polymerase II small subunit [Methanomethylophilus sp.]MDD3232971.1 DNA-directed DNA polymerase II small subunit [Methanomethylophilus sp.]MDD4221886.1 DNA-directed DNA polymerase II small subunit [Methanomethylophilus sp.]MDD4668659.1 DNA-directed DNA polymerase II small subunit [Methanomethylophilus sp.]
MKEEVLSAAARRNLFLSPEALEIIDSNGYPIEFVNTLLTALAKNTMFVTKKDVIDFLNGDKTIAETQKTIAPKNKRQTDIAVIPGTDVTGQSTCVGNIEDFAAYFRSRYNLLKKIIVKRRDFGPSVSIKRAIELGREINIVGMVYERRTTKNGHMILTVEDETGSCPVFISKDSPLISETFVDDEVIGISGKPASRGNLFIANEIYHPDIPAGHRWEPSDSVSSIAFISDVHCGSKTFLRPQWEKMITWLRANAHQMDLDYIVMPGDVVDGIGTYPGQEDELEIKDIYDQYSALSDYLKEIPDDIRIVLHPGNHDACRLAEPQPALSEIFTKTFDSSIMMVGNPINLRVEGRTVVSYHGKSIDDWISGVRQLTYEDPLAVMKEMAVRRHLAPMYGQRNALAPEKKDYLVMDEVPDIFVSGHVHGAGTMEYRGVKMINASTWQSQTDYQKMHNFNPDPGIVPIVHLGNGRVVMKNFMD